MKLKIPTLAACVALCAQAYAGNGNWTLLGWNNLGMHCMDDDYLVFSILPPYNTLNAQLIDSQGHLVKNPTGLRLTYEAIADPTGSINRTSVGKTNFWVTASDMYASTATVPDIGLAGTKMPGLANAPQPFTWTPGNVFNWFEATGIPITPLDDAQHKNSYPLMRLKARNSAGTLLAQADVVLPVSDEMDCRACHASSAGPAARPQSGWENDPNPKHDFRYNILILHDEKQATNRVYANALVTAGYDSRGLYATAKSGHAILCAECHSSEALPGTGVAGISPLTRAMHRLHAEVKSPLTGLALGAATNRAACYECHPGSTTQCLRGAMGAAVTATNGQLAMQCQSCHGGMSQVGAATRTGWLQEPNCQACHTGTATSNSGQIRYTSAFTSTGQLRVPANKTFATNPDTPMTGTSLYRFSKGHGGVQCSACHGSTHAEWPSIHANDNLLAKNLQGHSGVLIECLACHAKMPTSASGGPHGMHPISANWAHEHGEGSTAGCTSCHGTTYKGTVLSRSHSSRSFSAEGTTAAFWPGQTVSCYECHNGPKGEGKPPAAPKVNATATLTLASGATSGTAQIASTPTTGITLRVVDQPANGTAAVQGTKVVYYPRAGFKGTDKLNYAVSNGTRESNLGVLTITVK